MRNFNLPILGGGAGLRHEHFETILEEKLPFRWFEIITDDFMDIGGYVREAFDQIRSLYPVIPHSVGLSIGSTDPLDMDYLKSLKKVIDLIDAPWFSDHLCFTAVDHTNLEDLIPLPFTKEAANNVIERAKRVRDFIGRPLLLENVTRYVTVSDREMSEVEFLCTVLEGADIGLLLDVTNVYLNSQFHGYDALEFMKSIPHGRVGQMHLAGWEAVGDVVIDSHDAPVPPEVWELFKRTLEITGPTSVIVEWDNLLPDASRLLKEAQMADSLIFEHQQAA